VLQLSVYIEILSNIYSKCKSLKPKQWKEYTVAMKMHY